LKDLTLLDKIEVFVDDKAFREEWAVSYPVVALMCLARRSLFSRLMTAHSSRKALSSTKTSMLKSTLFKDFVKIYGPDRFTNVTNGITPRRWLHQGRSLFSRLMTAHSSRKALLSTKTSILSRSVRSFKL
jgi:hypothetical protein